MQPDELAPPGHPQPAHDHPGQQEGASSGNNKTSKERLERPPNLNLPSNPLVTSRDSLDFPSPRSCQALPSGRVKGASSCNFAFPDLDMFSSLRAGIFKVDFFMILS